MLRHGTVRVSGDHSRRRSVIPIRDPRHPRDPQTGAPGHHGSVSRNGPSSTGRAGLPEERAYHESGIRRVQSPAAGHRADPDRVRAAGGVATDCGGVGPRGDRGGGSGGGGSPWRGTRGGWKSPRPAEVPEGLDSQFAHATFATWTIGARAHVQHLLAYCGLPVTTDLVDPRFSLVSAAVTTWAELGGRWAPSPSYGVEVEAMIGEVRAA